MTVATPELLERRYGAAVAAIGRGPLHDDQRAASLEGIRRQQCDLLGRDPDVVDRIAAAAEGYFTERYPATMISYLNALQREQWRVTHGDTRVWDRVAKAKGVYTIGEVIL